MIIPKRVRTAAGYGAILSPILIAALGVAAGFHFGHWMMAWGVGAILVLGMVSFSEAGHDA